MSDNETASGESIDDLSIGEIDKELAAIDEKLDTLPSDDFVDRVDLHQRHQALKARAAQLNTDADEQRSTADLQTEITSLKQRIAAIQGDMTDTSEQDSEGNIPGPHPSESDPSVMNQEIADGHGAPALVSRLNKLEGILASRGVDAD